MKELKRALDSANDRLAMAEVNSLLQKAEAVGAVKVLTARLNTTVDEARRMCDSIKSAHPDMVVVFAVVQGEKLNFVACCGEAAVKAGAHAGNILRTVSAITGGKGGGRPDSAMSGGKEIAKVDEALAEVKNLL